MESKASTTLHYTVDTPVYYSGSDLCYKIKCLQNTFRWISPSHPTLNVTSLSSHILPKTKLWPNVL